MDKPYKYTQFAALVLGIFTPCILLAGYVYHLGYIDTFGLDSSIMGRGFSDVITESWYMGLRILGYFAERIWYPIWFSALALLFFLGIMYFFVWLKAIEKDLFANEITKENQGRTILGLTIWQWGCWWELVEYALGLLLAAIIALFFAMLVVALPFQFGKEDALKKIADYREFACESLPSRCVTLEDISSPDAQVLTQGIMVTANKERIAIFAGDAIEVWPLRDSYKLARPYRGEMDSKGVEK